MIKRVFTQTFGMEQDTLRDMDIKQEVKDYLAGKQYPLDLIEHTLTIHD